MDINERAALKVLLTYFAASTRNLADNYAGRPRKWESATNAYKRDIGSEYDKWSRKVARELSAATTEDERNEIIELALVLLFATMRDMGRKNISQGMFLGLGGYAPSPRLLEQIAQYIRENERYLEDGFMRDVETRLRNAARDTDVLEVGIVAILGMLIGARARAERYAGGMWAAINIAVGEVTKQQEESGGDGRVFWELEPTAEHCPDCLRCGDREYPSYDLMLLETGNMAPGIGVQCDGNCRCSLKIQKNGEWVRP